MFGVPTVDISTSTDPTQPNAIASWTEPTATDNSNVVTITVDHSQEFKFPIGVTPVTYTATDDSGNSVVATSFYVTVNGEK